MTISLAQLTRANAPKPPRILIHGVAGVGKTTFAAEANKPVFVQTEDGLGTIPAANFPLARTFEEVLESLASLYTEDHDFKTVVIDSVDWLEPLVWGKACRDNGWASIEELGYGRGYIAALNLWRQYIEGLNALRDDRGMTVVQIAHTDIKRFDTCRRSFLNAWPPNSMSLRSELVGVSSLPRIWKRRSTKTRSRKALSMKFSRTRLTAKVG